jgi:hypothetical protein
LARTAAAVLLALSTAIGMGLPAAAQSKVPTLCTDGTKQGTVLEVADALADAGLYERAEELYKGWLAKNPTDSCAARGLAFVSQQKDAAATNADAERAASRWDEFYADWIEPATRLLLPFIAVLLVLLVLARLATPFAVSPQAKTSEGKLRRFLWWFGMALLVVSAVGVIMAAPLYQAVIDGAARSFTWPAWVLALGLAAMVALGLRTVADRLGSRAPAVRLIAASGLTVMVLLVGVGLVTGSQLALWGLWILALVAAALGVYLVAAARGQDLRLQVAARTATGQADPDAADYVIGRLEALGSGRPRGLEIPQQTDVTALPDQALSALPQGRIAAALSKVLQAAIVPAVPWRATVSKLNDDTAAVTLTRNGRLADAVVISRPLLALPPIPVEGKGKERDDKIARAYAQLLTAAAAFILLRLSDRHHDLKKGLCGAHQWQSVAGHVLATEKPLAEDPGAQKALLAVAVDTDPNNALACVAHIHLLGRQADDWEGQQRFALAMQVEYEQHFSKLSEQQPPKEPKKGFEALQLRMLFSIAAAWLNCYLLLEKKDEDVWGNARNAASVLVRRLDRLGKDPVASVLKLEDFVTEMRSVAGYLCLGIHDETGQGNRHKLPEDVLRLAEAWTSAEPPPPLSLKAMYDRACWRAEKAGAANTQQLTKALDDLELAVGLEDLRLWARDDPAFEALRQDVDELPGCTGDDAASRKNREQALAVRRRYRRLVGDKAPSDLLDLLPFAELAPKLHALGIHDAKQLDKRTRTWLQRRRLARQVGIGTPVVERWRRLAKLAQIVGETPSDSKVISLLLAENVDSPDALRRRKAAELHKQLRKAATSRDVIPPTKKTIEEWMRRCHHPIR